MLCSCALLPPAAHCPLRAARSLPRARCRLPALGCPLPAPSRPLTARFAPHLVSCLARAVPLPAGTRISLAAQIFILNEIGGQHVDRRPTLEKELFVGRRELSCLDRIQLATFKFGNMRCVHSLFVCALGLSVCLYASCMRVSDVDLNVIV